MISASIPAAPANPLRIGIDLGGTKIEGVALHLSEPQPEVLYRKRVATGRERGYDHILETVASLILEVGAAAGCSVGALPPIGVGMPGSINRAGVVKNSNTTCLNGRSFREELSRRVGQPIAFSNDANCFALAEARYGGGRGHELVFGVILGTGVGGGIVLPGPQRPVTWNGPQGIGGEWGHVSLDPVGGPACYCGQRGCVESYLCGPALEADYARRSGVSRPLAELESRSRTGDADATATLRHAVEIFGRALANVVNILDPDVIVLGGGVSKLDLWYSDGPEAVRRWVFGGEFATPVVRHQLSDSAGVIGAALLPTDAR